MPVTKQELLVLLCRSAFLSDMILEGKITLPVAGCVFVSFVVELQGIHNRNYGKFS